MTERQMTTVRGHWRNMRDGTRKWIDSHLRCSGGETVAQARERVSRRHCGACETCGGPGWVFRDETKSRCKLCPACEGQGYGIFG